jgi:hypothetical protein
MIEGSKCTLFSNRKLEQNRFTSKTLASKPGPLFYFQKTVMKQKGDVQLKGFYNAFVSHACAVAPFWQSLASP